MYYLKLQKERFLFTFKFYLGFYKKLRKDEVSVWESAYVAWRGAVGFTRIILSGVVEDYFEKSDLDGFYADTLDCYDCDGQGYILKEDRLSEDPSGMFACGESVDWQWDEFAVCPYCDGFGTSDE